MQSVLHSGLSDSSKGINQIFLNKYPTNGYHSESVAELERSESNLHIWELRVPMPDVH